MNEMEAFLKNAASWLKNTASGLKNAANLLESLTEKDQPKEEKSKKKADKTIAPKTAPVKAAKPKAAKPKAKKTIKTQKTKVDTIIDIIKDSGGATSAEIIATSGFEKQSVYNMLSSLKRKGRIEKKDKNFIVP